MRFPGSHRRSYRTLRLATWAGAALVIPAFLLISALFPGASLPTRAAVLLISSLPPGDAFLPDLVVPPASAQVNWDAWKPDTTGDRTYPELLVSVEEVRNPFREVVVVDARSPDAFSAGHIPGARHLDVRGLLVDPPRLALELGRRGISARGTAYCYSDQNDPGAAGRLLWLLELAGHPDVRVLQGGFEAWREAGAPVVSGAPEEEPTSFDATLRRDLLATREYVRDVFGTPGHAILEWRNADTWAGGHIPHSLPFPLAEVAEMENPPDGAALHRAFAQWGPRPREYVPVDDEIIVLGDDPPGAMAVDGYLVARLAGRSRVRVFPGGLREWRDAGLPLTRLIDTEQTLELLTSRGARELRDTPPPDVVLLDLRGARDFEVGHIPGAVSLTTNRSPEDLEAVLAQHWPGVDRATVPLVAYCYGPSCTRSRNGTTLAARAGFRTVLWFRGGITGWRAQGNDLVSGTE